MYDFMEYNALAGECFTGLEIPPAPLQANIPEPVKKVSVADKLMSMLETPQQALKWARLARMFAGRGIDAENCKTAFNRWKRALIDRATDALNNTSPQTFLAFEPSLRWLMKVGNRDMVIVAQGLMQDLYLAQTSNDPSLWWEDSNTGEVDAEANTEMATNVIAHALINNDAGALDTAVGEIELARKAIEAAYEGVKAPETPTSENSLALRITQEYDAPVAKLALRAASGNLGDLLDEEEPMEDRGWQPATLEKDFNPKMYLADWTYANAYRSHKRECWQKAFRRYPPVKGSGRKQRNAERRQEFLDLFMECKAELADVPVRKELIEYIGKLAILDMQAAACYAYPFLLIEEDAGDSVDLRPSELPADVLEAIETFENDIAERGDALHQSEREPEFVEALDKYDEEFLSALAATMPERDQNPTRTSAWQMSYMRSIASGSTQVQAESTAWAAWRQAMSPTGALAYDKAITSGASQSKAMAMFWQKCGPDVPRKQAVIKSVNYNGVVITWNGQERTITWYIADKKLLAGELDLSKKDKLIEVLSSKNWPFARYFLSHLKSK